jgi:hypothetical protein
MGIKFNSRLVVQSALAGSVFGAVFFLIGLAAINIIEPEARFYSSVVVSGTRETGSSEEFRFDTSYLQQASGFHAQSVKTLLTAKSSAQALIGDLTGCDSQYPIFAESEDGSSVVRFEVRCALDEPEQVNQNISNFISEQYFDSLDTSEISWSFSLSPFEKIEQSIPSALILLYCGRSVRWCVRRVFL